jgi:uncharacterized protein GlcG (DUF336 family)
MNKEINDFISRVFDAIEKMIPLYMGNPLDKNIANGNVAVCIIGDNGQLYGRMFGEDKARQRQTFKIAWTKASQVWLTGVKTGEYERMVFNKEVEENANGIEAPDLIGWEGGQPLTLANGTKLSVGFSGFRGVIDLEIMVKAFAEAEQG